MNKLPEIIKKLDLNQARIAAHGKFDDALLKKINYKLRLDWNYYSNRMEGGTLTRAETRSVMVGNIDVHGKPLKDIMEMNGHDQVVLDVLKMSKGELTLSEKRIKDIHKAIMHPENEEQVKLIGDWKKEANEVINYKNEKILFTSPYDVPDAMHKLLDKTNVQLSNLAKSKLTHPVVLAAQFHIDFITIHPFFDGNGRTTRILTNIILMACGFPAIIIKDEHKKQYYKLLADIQAYGGRADLFYEFIGERVLNTQQLLLDAIEGKDIEEDDDINKEIDLFVRSISINKESNRSKSNEYVIEILADSGKILFDKLKGIYDQFDKLFHNHEERFIFSNASEVYNLKERSGGRMLAINEQFPDSFVTWVKNNDTYDIHTFGIEFYWKGFRRSTPAFNLGIYIFFTFDEYAYHISRTTTYDGLEHYLEKHYDQQLDKDDISFTVNNIAKSIMKEIKNNYFED